jgi:hypothetical protein
MSWFTSAAIRFNPLTEVHESGGKSVVTHVPMSRQTCLQVGIDRERWLRNDLLDILVAGSGYQPLSMTRKIVELG